MEGGGDARVLSGRAGFVLVSSFRPRGEPRQSPAIKDDERDV